MIISSPSLLTPDTDPYSFCNMVLQWGVHCKTENTNNYFLDLNPNTPSVPGSSGMVKIEDPNFPLEPGLPFLVQKNYVMDFNGDGKMDILKYSPQSNGYSIYSLKELNQAPWMAFEIIGTGALPEYAEDKPILFGDYNADGKTDLMIPVAVGSPSWAVYYSNPTAGGSSFFTKVNYDIINYDPTTTGATFQHWNNYSE